MAQNNKAKALKTVNWEVVTSKIKDSPYTHKEIGTLMNKSRSWVSVSKKQNSRIDEDDLTRLALILSCDVEELTHIEKPISDTPTCESGEQVTDDVSVRLATLETKVDELLAKVDKMYEFLSALSSEEKQIVTGYDFTKMPRNQRAKIILEGLVAEGYGKCLHSTFLTDLMKNNIGSSYAEQAMKDLGYQKATTGFGNGVTTYIIDPHWEEPKREETK